MAFSFKNLDDTELINYLKNLELRIKRLEEHKNLDSPENTEENINGLQLPALIRQGGESLEFQIGEFWFAKVGIAILAIGIAFLLTFPFHNLPAGVPIIIGYSLVLSLAVISHLWRNSFTLISQYLLGGGLLLFYFTTLRLHYFGDKPVLADNLTELILLLFVVVINLYISIRRKSVYLTSITITLGYITSILTTQPLFQFMTVCLLSIIVVYIQKKYKWPYFLHYGIILTYLSHFIWFINNPFLGNTLQLSSSPSYNIYFILLYILIFSLANYLRDKESIEDNQIALSMFLNSFGGFGLYLLITLTKFQEYLALNHLLISILFLSFSILYWIKYYSKNATSFYAIIGYTALSVALIAQFTIPDAFIWLSWQSLLVITTAIWFRSKFIIVANFLIYVIIFITYLFLAGTVNIVSLSFGFVALISARILNWQKERLELRTELMRNSYLACVFFMFPYALYHTVPSGYVSLSWVGVAGFYYLLSIILKNKKYRWMALLTFILTALYLLAIGTINFDPVFRLISFIVLGSALIIVSILYTKVRKKNNPENSIQN